MFKRLKLLFSLFFLVFYSILAFAQEFSVTGIVNDAGGEPVPGVTVIEQGTTNGVITNLEGQYLIKVSSTDATLEFRSVGMQSQIVPVNSQSQINIILQAEVYTFNEVVVTALGISKETKALGYSVTAVNNEDLTEAGDKNMLTALQGKMAGVNITSSSGAPGASTRIMVRGVSSLSGSNQPLFVIDGVPANNSQSGSVSINGGTDFGNKINDINMDDIESVSFLKGASGTALYGSRAANGVIIINTKKGASQTKARISYTGGMGFEKPLRLVKYQNEYGQGIFGNHVLYENMSWGPAFDNQYRPWGNMVDDSIRVKAYRALDNNVEEFFDLGFSTNHALSVSGGNDQTTYYISYSNVCWDGIFPTKSDSYKRHNFSVRGSQKISKGIQLSGSLNYLHKNNSYVPTGQGDASVYNQVMQTPRDISLLEQEDINLIWNTIDNHYSLYTVNPWYILYNDGNKNTENRIYGNLEVNAILPFQINAIWRLGADVSSENREEWREAIRPSGNNEQSSVFDPGMRSRSFSELQQLNSDFILTWEKQFQDFGINIMAGQSVNERKSTGFATSVSYLSLEGFPTLSNSLESPSSSEASAMVRNLGIYGGMDLSYKSILYLAGTIRNEWSSTLPVKNNSYLFPGINASFVFSEILQDKMNFISFGKLRASWAMVGNDAPPYYVNPIYQQAGHSDGYGYFSFPTSTAVNSYEVGNYIGNPDLRPEMTTEFEVGLDLRLFRNRLFVDGACYYKSTKDLIWASPMATTSGYSTQMQNLGEMINYGAEILLGITPLKRNSFEWRITTNFTRNFNELVALNSQMEKAELNSLRVDAGQQISWLAIPGMPVGVFEARAPMYTEDGKMLVDNQGLPIADSDLKIYGNSQYKFYGGVTNTFILGGFSVNASIDYRIGGIMYSRTKDITLWAGTVPETLYNDREPFVVPDAVYETGRDENGNPVYSENTIPIDRIKLVEYWGNGGVELDGASLIDKSFVKLREVSLGYNLPEKYLESISVSKVYIGISGKNLFLWTPKDQYYIDPELSTFGNDLLADFGEYGAQPSVRSLSFNVKVDF